MSAAPNPPFLIMDTTDCIPTTRVARRFGSRHAIRVRLLMLWLVLPVVVQAEDYIFTTTNGAITITGYTGSGGEVAIPGTIKDLPVTSIGEYAFNGRSSLGGITIPDRVTSIGGYAFQNCASLTNLTIGNRVTSIGDRAFSGCTSLISITIPDSVTKIGEDALLGCTSLTNVTIGSGITNLVRRLSGCRSLATITVAARNSVYSSVDGVLFNKSQMTLIQCPEGRTGRYSVPDGVAGIGANAFADCASLTNIAIPDSVTAIAGMRSLAART